MTRFLHTADWQIGRQYDTFDPEHAPLLAEARITVVERLAALATAQAVDAVLVAGDVFDKQTVSDRTIRRLFNALAGFSGPWVMIPGNHDAALSESVWTRAQRLGAVPANAHVLLRPAPMDFAEQGFVVLPAPLTQRHTYADLTAWFDTADTPDGLLRIGLAHGSVQGILAEDIDSANPIAPDRPSTARLDYLALGDWHGCKIVHTRLAYSGTPEPDRFKSNGAGQVLLVEIAGPGGEPALTALPTGQFRWQQLDITLQVSTDLDGLVEQLQAFTASDVVDLTLQGQIDLPGHQRWLDARGQAEARARLLQVHSSGLRLMPTDDDLAGLQADGYLGVVIAELRDAQSAAGEEGVTAQAALAILTAALAQGQPTTAGEGA